MKIDIDINEERILIKSNQLSFSERLKLAFCFLFKIPITLMQYKLNLFGKLSHFGMKKQLNPNQETFNTK